MTPLHLFLTVLGAVRAVELFMRFIEWIDTPRKGE